MFALYRLLQKETQMSEAKAPTVNREALKARIENRIRTTHFERDKLTAQLQSMADQIALLEMLLDDIARM